MIVMKFGGTSLATTALIKSAAKIVKDYKEIHNERVIVVVSAMHNVTNHISSLIESVDDYDQISPEYDSALSAGEQISASLFSLSLQSINVKSRSLLGWQLPINTDNNHGNAKIISINTQQLITLLQDDIIPIIAGFQGINNNRITTLSRGGSDITAVAIAAALKLEYCNIYTDVSGVFTKDPNVYSDAKIISQISYENMLNMSTRGARVIHPEAVRLAMMHKIKIRVLSTFKNKCGTTILEKIV